MVRYPEAMALADKLSKGLKATDPRLQRYVQVTHEDGSGMFFTYAFMLEYEGWLLVFTEHQGTQVFSKGDLSFYAEFDRRGGPERIDGDGKTITDYKCEHCGKVVPVEETSQVYFGGEPEEVCETCANLIKCVCCGKEVDCDLFGDDEVCKECTNKVKCRTCDKWADPSEVVSLYPFNWKVCDSCAERFAQI